MDPEYVVLEVSSDEDVGLGENLGFDDSGEDDCDWIEELLNEVDKASEDSNDSDDVVLVSEVVLSPKSKLKNSDTGLKALDDDEDEDDCVVLDGDPDKLVTVENIQMVDESDELQVVAETGQVACRDYPHPRHLCVKYPFTSTAHEKICNQCHCYVCDSLAPCLHWDANHCHATDKEEFWKIERKSLKNSHQTTVSFPKVFSSLSAGAVQISQGSVSLPFEPTYIPPSQVPGPAAIRACSRSTSFPGFDHSGRVVPSNRFQPNLVLQHLRGTGNDGIQRDRRHASTNALQVKSPPAVFKRTGLASPLLPNRRNCSSNQTYRAQFMRIPPPVPVAVNNSMRWQPLHAQMGSELNTYQFPSQPNIHANYSNSLPYQPQLSLVPNVMNNHLNMVPSQPMVSPQSNTANIFVSSVTSQPQVPSQAYYYGNTFLRPAQSQLSFQPVVDNSYANRMPSEPVIYGQPDSAPNDDQNVQHVNQVNSFLDWALADIDLDCVNPTSDSNQEFQHQDTGLVTQNETLPHTELDNLFGGSTNVDALNFQYDSWNLGSSDKPVHSPEPDISDSSFFLGL